MHSSTYLSTNVDWTAPAFMLILISSKIPRRAFESVGTIELVWRFGSNEGKL